MTPAATVRIRSAELSDLDDLVALEEHSFTSDRLSRAQFRRHLDSDSAKVLVASTGPHRFLGTAVVFFRKRSGVARLYSIATHHAARGQGVGSALLDATEQLARRRRCRALPVRTPRLSSVGGAGELLRGRRGWLALREAADCLSRRGHQGWRVSTP